MSIEHMESYLFKEKTKFDNDVTINPTLSLAVKQGAFARFLQRIQPTVAELTKAYEARRYEEVQNEARAYAQIQRGKRGAA